ncbi:MAG: carbamoyl phosphate synthase small subunit [Lachnospiraceae bacterium]|nr:carbamoyl phosphate synthase small subunit [Lachnospiraceae bacterium]
MKAFLILEDKTVYEGEAIGADKTVISEIVFNTSMAGYPEVLTDPSYAGQAVCMTYPLIGNYGICIDDLESQRPWPDGLIVREISRTYSNFRADMPLDDFLKKYDVPGIAGIDTRDLTKRLREKGTMNGMITRDENVDIDAVVARLKEYTPSGVVMKTTTKEIYEVKGATDLSDNGPLGGAAVFDKAAFEAGKKETAPAIVKELNGTGLKVAIMDFGAKRNIGKSLAARGCDVTVYPADTPADKVLADKPDGIMLSNGPGDPKECVQIIEEVKKMVQSGVPIFAICLGHQIMALAHGFDTYKLKYGHRGGNHPVKDLSTGRVYISSQNHGYVVDVDTVDPNVAEPAFINVNDKTNEGLRYLKENIFTVQFHPEACPGPQDSSYLFDRFINMMRG